MTDYNVGDTFDIKFSTRSFSTGAPTTLAGTPAVSAYPDNSTTQITAGITLTVDFDSVTGLHNVRVVATGGNGYASGSSYDLVITTGTVGGVSVVGEVIGSFTLNRSAAAQDLANATDGLGAIKAETAAILDDTDLIDNGTSGLAKIATDVAATLVDTGTTIPGQISGLNNISAAQVNAEVDTALADYDGPTRAELTSDKDEILARLRWVVLMDGTIGATGNSTTAIHLPGLTYGNDEINGYFLVIYDSSADEYHWRQITDWVLSTELATVDALPFTPQDSTDTYAIIATLGAADVTGGDATAANQSTIIALLGTPAADVSADIAALKVVADAIEVDTQNIQSRLPTALINGRMRSLNALESGTAQAGAAATITLSSGASTNDDIYNGQLVTTTGGTGALQTRLILDYVGSTRVATVYPNWDTNPSSDTTYAINPWGAVDLRLWRGSTPNTLVSGLVDVTVDGTGMEAGAVSAIAAGLNDLDSSEVQTAAAAALTAYDPPTRAELTTDINSILTILGTPAGADLAADIAAIDSAIAALNDFDPSAETVNVGSISGDSAAADKLEAMMDGIFTAAAEGTPSTTVIQTDLAETTDDIYIGRLVTFLTGNAAGEQTDITDYTGSTGTITVTALAATPTAGDLMVIH